MNPKSISALVVLYLVAIIGVVLPRTGIIGLDTPINTGDTAWMLTASGLVLLMTPGLSFFYGGMVRKKNVISTMLQSFVALGVISLVWVVCGFSLSFGESFKGLIGNPFTHFMLNGVGGKPSALAPTIPLALFALFQLKFAIITPALITGAFAERVRFKPYLLFITLWSIFIYTPLAHWTWHPDGFLHKWGVLDFAGGTVVHISGGVAALAAAMFFGPRKDFSKGANHAPANIPYVLLGTGLLWFGWFGFNAGSALAANDLAVTAFLNTNTASAAAMLAWMFLEQLQGKKPSAMGGCVGAVVGLVAITPAAGYVTVGQSLFIGVVASTISYFAVYFKTRSGLDDTLDVFPCHGVGGIVGMIFTAIFAKDGGLITGSPTLFYYHLLTLAIVIPFVFVGSMILYKFTDLISPFRVSDKSEDAGLDQTEHGESIAW